MSAVTKSIAISASPEKIIGILLDVDSHLSWQKEIEKIEVLERDTEGRPLRTRTHVLAMGQHASYVVQYAYLGADRFEYHLIEGDVMTKNDFTVEVANNGPSDSDVTVTMAIDIKWPLPEFMIDQLAIKGVTDMLKTLKTKAEDA